MAGGDTGTGSPRPQLRIADHSRLRLPPQQTEIAEPTSRLRPPFEPVAIPPEPLPLPPEHSMLDLFREELRGHLLVVAGWRIDRGRRWRA